MNGQVYLYFSVIILTLIVTTVFSVAAWRQSSKPGIKAFAVLAAIQAGTALMELFSMISIRQSTAFFWFNVRFLFNASLPVFFFIFAFRYSGGKEWLDKSVIAFLFLVPLATQFMVWTNPTSHFWVEKEVIFSHIGPFWIAHVGTRVPGVWFMVHSFYSLILMLVGIAVILISAWRKKHEVFWRSILLTLGAAVGLVLTLNTAFSLFPKLTFNIFVPGIGLTALIYGIAVLRFDFFKKKEKEELPQTLRATTKYETQTLGRLIVILAILLTGIATIGVFSYRSYSKNQSDQVKAQLLSVAHLKVNGLKDWREERMGDASSITNNHVLSELLQKYLQNSADETIRTDLQGWLDSTRKAYQYEHIMLVDNLGGILIASPEGSLIDSEHIQQLIDEVKDSKEIVWRDFHLHSDGQINLSLLAPVFSPDGKKTLLGVVILEIDPGNWLYPYLQEWSSPSETAETLLVRTEEDGVLFLNPVRFDPQAALKLKLPFSESQVLAVKGALGFRDVVEGLDYRGVRVIGAIEDIPGSPWIMVARIDKAEALAPVRARLWETIFFFGFMGAAISSGIILLWRQRATQYYQEQLKLAESVAESEEKFRKAFQVSPDSVSLSKTESGEIVMINQGFEQTFGFLPGEVIGSTYLKLGIWVDQSVREGYIDLIRSEGSVQGYEVQFKTKDGEIRSGLVSGAMVDIGGVSHLLHTTRDITEERKTQQDYRTLFREMLDGWAVHEMIYDEKGEAVDYRFLTVNPAFERLTGLEAIKVVGHSVMEVLPGTESKWIENYGRVVLTGEPMTFEDFSKELNKYFEVIAFKSGPNQFVTIFADITRRKVAEQALLAYNDRLKTLADILQYKAGSTQEFLDYSLEQSIRLTGSKIGYIYLYDEDKEEFTLNSWSRDVMKECNVLDPQTCYQLGKTGIWGEAVRQRKPIVLNDFQATHPLKKGYPPGHVSLQKYLTIPIFDDDRIIAVTAVANKEDDYTDLDISQLQLLMDAVWKVVQKRRSEEAVQLSEARYRLMAENTTDVIWVMDVQSNRFKYISPSVFQLRGFTPEEVLEQPFDSAVLPEAVSTVKSLIESRCRQFIENGAAPISFIDEVQQPCKDGSAVPTEVTSTYLQNEQGEMEIIGVSRDITARKKAEETLKQYSEHLEDMVDERTRDLREAQERLLRQERLATLGQLAGSIAHELRNPLGVISNAVAFLTMVLPEAEPKVKEYLGIIEGETQTSEKIIADLLDFTRLQIAEKQPESVEKMISGALFRHPAPDRIEVIRFIPPDLPEIYVNRPQIEQVLGNLIENAYQAMHKGGRLEISSTLQPESKEENEFVQIQLKDSGEGIALENLSKIFEPLFTTKAKGIGLGLAICRKYVEANGGRITAVSEPGIGTTFSIDLPVRQEKK